MAEPAPEFDDDDRDIFDLTEEEDARLDAIGIADADAGRVISHEAMARWMMSWGTADELPPPKVGD